ncbi:MAG: hypothetical protein ABL907_09085 [Hyphomicrobium sp.]
MNPILKVAALGPTLGAALAAWTAMAAADDAPTLYQSHFAGLANGTPCYARSYTAEHLKAHPEQKVRKIELDMDRTNAAGKPMTEEAMELGFGVQLKTSPEWYTNVAICKSAGAEIQCFLEGDGGRFRLTAAEDGALKLETGDYGIAMEGTKDFIDLPGDKGDDRVFLLYPAPQSECDAATADTGAVK